MKGWFPNVGSESLLPWHFPNTEHWPAATGKPVSSKHCTSSISKINQALNRSWKYTLFWLHFSTWLATFLSQTWPCPWPLERGGIIQHAAWRVKVCLGVGAFLSVKSPSEGDKETRLRSWESLPSQCLSTLRSHVNHVRWPLPLSSL